MRLVEPLMCICLSQAMDPHFGPGPSSSTPLASGVAMRESLLRDAVVLALGLAAGWWLSPRATSAPVRAPGLKAWRMSKFVRYKGVIRTQGLCGDFAKMPSSTAQQTAEALAKLDGILSDNGVGRSHLLAVTIFLADLTPSNFEEMNAVYDAWVDAAGLPTRLCVQAKLGHGAAIEIRAEAWCQD
ncbi:hypothetical protein M885DRAFT_524671 [Pelagophyceae sp. CCMP2097]|nr:hypothetical protein M885DRAFT_524671 [Pelagophyceae sp. CCMP2097]